MIHSAVQRICILLLVLAPTQQRNWQGTGSMTDGNMTDVRTAIANSPIASTSTDLQIDAAAQAISTRLNQLWDTAWNVVITKTRKFYDTILYGYAFRDHWLWMNSVAIPSDSTNVLAYVIWKDYNCHTWATLNSLTSSASTFSSAQKTAIQGFAFTGADTDIWDAAFRFVEYLNVQPTLSSGAYSVVVSQYYPANMRGYVCLVNKNYALQQGLIFSFGNPFGTYFMFQTR